MEALCRRVVVIHEGRLLYDGDLRGLAERLAPFKILGIALEAGATAPDWARYGERTPAPNGDDGRVQLRVPKGRPRGLQDSCSPSTPSPTSR